MNKKYLAVFTSVFLLAAFAVFPQASFARALGEKEKDAIACAQFKMYVLSKYFDVKTPLEQKIPLTEAELKQGKKGGFVFPDACGERRAKKPVPMPDWFIKDTPAKPAANGRPAVPAKEAELPRLEKNKVIFVQDDNQTYSEADLWSQAFSNIALYLNRALQSMDPTQPLDLQQLSRGFVQNRIRLTAAIDRLNKDLPRGNTVVVMKDSLGGRARGMLATLELINGEFFSTIEAFSSPRAQQEDKYRKSVMAVVTLSNELYSQFMMKTPVPMGVPDPKSIAYTKSDEATSLLLKLIGFVCVFAAVYMLIDNKRQDIAQMIAQYREKSSVWAEDFNRQFLTIDVKYIVFGTLFVFGVFGLLFGMGIGGFFGVFVFLAALGFGAVVSIRMPMAILDILKKSRGRKVNAQLMDALILLSNSLRSGMDIVQGFELVSRDMRPPIADEFGLVVKNYQLGTPFESALEGMSDRVDSRMLVYIIKAIIIQRQVGGNLTVIFSRLVENIREESKLEEKLQAMTAQQKIQSIVVGLMPFVMMAVMFLFNTKEMLAFYTSPVGLIVLFACIVWIMIGMSLIKKMGEVRV